MERNDFTWLMVIFSQIFNKLTIPQLPALCKLFTWLSFVAANCNNTYELHTEYGCQRKAAPLTEMKMNFLNVFDLQYKA